MFIGPDFVVTVRHAESPNLAGFGTGSRPNPELLALGPEAVLYAILDEVVDEYGPVVAGLENDIDEIEDQLFSGDRAVSRRIYELSREVIDFQRATQPLVGMIEALLRGSDKYQVEPELQRSLRDVLDHAMRIVDGRRRSARSSRTPSPSNATLVAQQPERRDAPHDRAEPRPERGGQEDLLLGGDPLSPPR